MHPPPPPPPPEIPESSVVGDTDGSSTVRTYRVWKGSNVFCLQGRLIFGPDVKSIFVSIFLIVAPVSVFCAFVARKLLDDFPHHAGLSIMIIAIVLTIFVLIVLLLTSGRDPGIVPRNAYPPELDDGDENARIHNGQITPQLRLPRTKDMIVNGIPIKVKYCDTCMLYRPPRCSHCSVCDNCVERFDHHCPWVGQCIGLRNYRFYYTFVLSATLLCLYIHAFCWVYITRIRDSEEISIWKAMIKTPASIALIIYSFICVWFVGGLTVFHTYLISTNQSTYENFRYRYDQQVNPYNRGILENIKEIFCTNIPPSKNKFRKRVPKEPSPPSRRVGVGPMSPFMRKPPGDVEMGERQVYSEADEEERDYKGGFSNDEELSKDSGLSHVSLDLSRNLPTEVGEGQDASYLGHSDWERRSNKWDITPQVLDKST